MNAEARKQETIARLLKIRQDAHEYLLGAAKAGRDFNSEAIRDRIESLAYCNAELEKLGYFAGK